VKNIKIYLLSVILLLMPKISIAQNFSKVIEIVGGMEESLKNMVANEERTRKTEIAELRSDITTLKALVSKEDPIKKEKGMQASADLSGVVERLEILENKFNSQIQNSQLSMLTGQMQQLIEELKNVIDEGKRVQQTSLKSQSASLIASTGTETPKEEELSALIAEMKKMISDYKPVPVVPSPSVIKVGVLAQFQGQALQEQTSATYDANPKNVQHWQRQIMIRRLRVLVGGNVTPATSFFFESDATNIGKLSTNGAKTPAVSMYVQDAQIQHTFMPELSVIAGLQLVGINRAGLQSAASLMALNYGAYQFVTSGPLDNSVGRDIGVNLRGFLIDEQLEYRLGMFSGKNVNMYSPLRVTGRFNYDFYDKEKGFYYAGTTLGTGNILAIGGGFDVQGSYTGISVDGFYDASLGSSGSVTVLAAVSHLDGGGSTSDSTVFTGLIPKQIVTMFEAGYFFKEYSLQPYLRFEDQNVNASVLKQVGATSATLALQNRLRSGSRYGIGLNYFVKSHTANIKVLYELVQRNRTTIVVGKSESVRTGELTMQLQYFFY